MTATASSSSAVNPGAIIAVLRRQLGSLLGNPLGYVFILAFVLATAAAMFLFGGNTYFQRNIADLSPLQTYMPWFIAVLLPALAMGAWAGERELGTEEMLLTLPLSVFDAVLGKYLAVVLYFTIALACSLSNVIALSWLGVPDWGLILANYAGWWLAGLVFAAFALLASVVVALPAVAFVVGLAFTGILVGGLDFLRVEWFDSFNRGVVPLSNIVGSLMLVVAALGVAVFILSSRRWRPGGGKVVAQQVLALVFGLALLVNVARITHRLGIDADVTAEGQASISQTGADALKDVTQPVTVNAFISAELPADLQAKAKEVLDKLKALQRAKPGLVTVHIRRPAEALDPDGVAASREFNLKPRKQPVDTVAGKKPADVFFGAAVSSGGTTQVIEYFDPGLSVEYELVRAVRGVAAVKKKILGIATTDLDINGGMDYQTYQMSPPWEIVSEWKKQYEVRPVNLDSPVAAEVDVLVVPQPSSLTQPQLENLHASIWSGRPTLLLDDPIPFFAMREGRSDLIPSQPKKGGNPMAGPDAGTPQKGDIKPLYKGLGLDFNLREALWSDYFPSPELKEMVTQNFVWTSTDQKGVADTPMTRGLTGLLLVYPGGIGVSSTKPASLEVKTLFTPTPKVTWGRDPESELLQQSGGMFGGGGGVQLKEAKHQFSGDRGNPAAMAVEITGTLPAVWPVAAPGAAPAAKDGAAPAEPERKAGIPSPKPIHVVVVADVDFLHNMFFNFYRNVGNQISKQEESRFLLDLRNVQLAANIVDVLASDQAFVDLRTRTPPRRPLTRLEDQLLATQADVRAARQKAAGDFESAQREAQASMDEQLAKIDERTDLDDNAKAQEKAVAGIREQRKLDLKVEQITQKRDADNQKADVDQQERIRGFYQSVKLLAIGTPALLLLLLVFAVYLRRVVSEKSHVPSARKRHA